MDHVLAASLFAVILFLGILLITKNLNRTNETHKNKQSVK